MLVVQTLLLQSDLPAVDGRGLQESWLRNSNKSLLQRFGNKGERVRKCNEEAKGEKGRRGGRI